ncbi:MAG: hypothetical protein IKJ77_04715 [Firmicutes bacterium]|nr:hypothetical protein [Bacillota bacterium]
MNNTNDFLSAAIWAIAAIWCMFSLPAYITKYKSSGRKIDLLESVGIGLMLIASVILFIDYFV